MFKREINNKQKDNKKMATIVEIKTTKSGGKKGEVVNCKVEKINLTKDQAERLSRYSENWEEKIDWITAYSAMIGIRHLDPDEVKRLVCSHAPNTLKKITKRAEIIKQRIKESANKPTVEKERKEPSGYIVKLKPNVHGSTYLKRKYVHIFKTRLDRDQIKKIRYYFRRDITDYILEKVSDISGVEIKNKTEFRYLATTHCISETKRLNKIDGKARAKKYRNNV